MNTFTDHALADVRHAERYAVRPQEHETHAGDGVRERFGALLVAAGLHLMTRSDRVSVSWRLAR